MGTKKISVRDYKFSDGLLKQKADKVGICVTRDIVPFNARGVTSATVTAYQGLITSFDNTTTDEELVGALMGATASKDAIAENVRMACRVIRTMAQNKFGVKSNLYRAYGFEGMDGMSDEKLYRLGKRVVRVATAQLSQLASEGLTMAMINAGSALNTSFDNSIDAHNEAIMNRDLQTQDRIDKGNLVFKEMMRLCNIGKNIFVATDEARYNDYVIYNTPSGEPPVTPA